MQKEKTDLRKRFEQKDSKKFTIGKYADSLSVDRSILSGVLDGKYNGKKCHRGTGVKRVILALKRDEIWLEDLPWEK